MNRSPRTSQQTAGDDSFLDIVANIVGILIILIVVAGVRASRAPVELPAESSQPVAEVESVVEPVVDEIVLKPPPGGVVEPAPWPQTVTSVPSIVDRTDEVTGLVEHVEVLEDQLDVKLQLLSKAQADLETKLKELVQARGERVDRRKVVAGLTIEDTQVRTQLEALRRDDQVARQRLEVLKQPVSPEVIEVRHRLTPVGRVVRGTEQHFHVRNGRVARIPLQGLKQRIRDQMSRYGRSMSRFPKHEGQVGPVDGFVMEYTVERRPARLADELRHGHAMIRIGVTRWTIRPEPELESETTEIALSSGSRYQTILRTSDPGAALTFWVYPDSFSEVRRLQAAAHRAGFRVAARPLPTGIPISGSPDGSRSQSQ